MPPPIPQGMRYGARNPEGVIPPTAPEPEPAAAAFILPTPLVITGSRQGNEALASLLQTLASFGMIVDETTP